MQNKFISTDVLYKELSYDIVGCFYAVYNELGPAHKEEVYHRALMILFKERKIVYESKKSVSINFKGESIGVYQPDFIIEDKIIAEIKSVLNMPKVFEKQLYYYIKGTKYKLGYLLNFGNESIDIRRRIYESMKNNDSR